MRPGGRAFAAEKDPRRGRAAVRLPRRTAARRRTLETSFVGILKTGSASMWIIVACSVIALAVAIERAIALWGFTARAKSLADAVTRALYRGDLDDGRAQCERSGSPAGDVFLAGLVAATPRAGGGPVAPEK